MDSSEDHGDYVPESLSSFLKEADKNLSEATAILNSQFSQGRNISPDVQSLDEDEPPTTLNPAAVLDTAQARALAFEGASPDRPRRRTPPVVKNLFEGMSPMLDKNIQKINESFCSTNTENDAVVDAPVILNGNTQNGIESFCSVNTENKNNGTVDNDIMVDTRAIPDEYSQRKNELFCSTKTENDATVDDNVIVETPRFVDHTIKKEEAAFNEFITKDKNPSQSSSKNVSVNYLTLNDSVSSHVNAATLILSTGDNMEMPSSSKSSSPQQALTVVDEDSSVPKENPVESQTSPRPPLSSLVNDFHSESSALAHIENQTTIKLSSMEMTANNMDDQMDLQLSPIPCTSSKKGKKEEYSSKNPSPPQQMSRAFRKDSPVSKNNPVESWTSPSLTSKSSPEPLSPVAINAMNRARNRVRQRKLAEQKRHAQLESDAVSTRIVQRKSSKWDHSKFSPTSISSRQSSVYSRSTVSSAKKARSKVPPPAATRKGAISRMSSYPKGPNALPFRYTSTPTGKKIEPTLAESAQSFGKCLRDTVHDPPKNTFNRPRVTTPKPFKFHESRSSISRGPTHERRGARKLETMAESMNYFGRHLRETPMRPKRVLKPTIPISPNFTSLSRRGRVSRKTETMAESVSDLGRHLREIPLAPNRDFSKPTVPVSPKFTKMTAESINDFGRHLRETPMRPKRVLKPTIPISPNFTSLSRRERVSRKTETMAESVSDFGRHLREIPLAPNRDFSKPTVPVSPKFTKMAKREKVKSTADKEQEVVDYYNTHRFKAGPIMTESRSSLSKNITKKKLTVPKPFKFNTTSRQPPKELIEDESQSTRFRARPIPKSYSRSSHGKESTNIFRERASSTFNSRLGIR